MGYEFAREYTRKRQTREDDARNIMIREQHNLQWRRRLLSSQSTQISDFRAIDDIGDRLQFFKNRRIQVRLRVNRSTTSNPRLTGRVKHNTRNHRCVGIIFRRSSNVSESFENSVSV